MIWKARNHNLSFEKPLIMGILNLTLDSFSDGGKFSDSDAATEEAIRLAHEGADILDLGAESTRPGAAKIPAAEQIQRLLPALTKIRDAVRIPISIDTTLPQVAEVCLAQGAEIINDVSGLRDGGKTMVEVVAKYAAGLVLMHRRGDAQTMQSLAAYGDVVAEVKAELQTQIEFALENGMNPAQIVIDPGIGFSKNFAQNMEILSRLDEFRDLNYPLMLGVSRKSFLGELSGKTQPADRDAATAACAALVAKHVQIHRVHNVCLVKQTLSLTSEFLKKENVRL